MKIFRSLEAAESAQIATNPKPFTVATLGVFDGVHAGHRHVIRECMSLAAERAGRSVVVTFVHHPRGVIAGKSPKLITSIDHRLSLFEDLGVDICLALDFDDALRQLSAEEFAHRVFEDALGADTVVLGHNCRFGHDREGGADYLQAHADRFKFRTIHAKELRVGEKILSSTTIRKAIAAGELADAAVMLGRPYSVWGTVVPGDGRGKTIGFPTANLDLHHELMPPRGVYGCRVELATAEDTKNSWMALANVGLRPTFGGDESLGVEVHLLDFEGDLYGRDLELEFLVYLRKEQKFAGIEPLVAAIENDRVNFMKYLEKG